MVHEKLDALNTMFMEGNVPILAANDRLGFREDSVYVDLGRAVDTS